MAALDPVRVRALLDAVAELPQALMDDLETGSHHRNNIAASRFATEHGHLMAALRAVHEAADAVEGQFDAAAA